MFAYRGREYRIDLGDDNRAAFDAAMAPWIESAKVTKQARVSRARPTAPEVHGKRIAMPGQAHSAEELQGLKVWAETNRVKISMGRAPVEVWQAFYDDDASRLPAERRITDEAA